MSLWRSLRSGLRSLVNRDALEVDLNDELAHYVEMAARENVRRGMSPEEALRAARAAVGGRVGLEVAKTDVRTSGWEAWFDTLRQDARVAVRGLRRSPTFTLVAIASLAIGIGANTTMFSVINAVIFRPLPYRDAGELALIWTHNVRRGLQREVTPWVTIQDWRAQTRTMRDIAYFSTNRVTPMTPDPGSPRGRSRNATVSGNLFSVLGVSAAMGRVLNAEDERAHTPVAVISHGFWLRFFNGSPDVLGKTLIFDGPVKGGGGTMTVVGVLPEGFYFPDRGVEIWTPATTYWRFDRERSERFIESARRWTAVGRLASGASLEDARTDFDRIGRHLAQVYPTSEADFPGFAVTLVPALEFIAGSALQNRLWMLLGAVALVLLIVCANLASLLLARGSARHREFAVRRALGAGRGRLVRQLGVESTALVISGGAVGVLLAWWGTPLLARAVSGFVPRMNEIALDGRVLLFALGATLAAGLVFGLVPAIRLSAADASEALREGEQGTARGSLRRSQSALVLAECAIALLLLTGAGLLLKSLDRLNSVDPGYDPANTLAVRLEFPMQPPDAAGADQRALGIARQRAYVQQLRTIITNVGSLPGVRNVGFMDDLFLAGAGHQEVFIPGRSPSEFPQGELNEGNVSPEFFATMHVPLRRGRHFTRDDYEQKIRSLWEPIRNELSLAERQRIAVPEPVIVNEAFVRRYFRDEDPVGKLLYVNPTFKTGWYEIVGVVGDMHRQGLEKAAIPEYFGLYIPNYNTRVDLVVRTAGDPLAMAGAVRAEVARSVPNITVVSATTVESQLGGFSAQRRMQTWLLTTFAALALGLAALGIFGLTHYSIVERTRELGVRIALGATPRDVIRLVIAQGMRMPIVGMALGIVASLGMTRIIASQLYDVQATDPATFVGVALLLALVAAGACYVAARRASQTDPIKALRSN